MKRHVPHHLSGSVRNRRSKIIFHVRKHTALLCLEEFMPYLSIFGAAGMDMGAGFSEQGTREMYTNSAPTSWCMENKTRLSSTFPRYREKNTLESHADSHGRFSVDLKKQ